MLTHKTRWVAEKCIQRLRLIEPLVYRRRQNLLPFRYKALPSPVDPPPSGVEVNDADWPIISPYTYWGQWTTDFVLHSTFGIPNGWNRAAPAALFLPLGEAGDFSHPEALAYIDGTPYAACDRHHQEMMLPDVWRDGQTHDLLLHGWTGLSDWERPQPGTRLLMGECAVVQLDQPTRDFIATARVALGVVDSLNANDPAHARLLTALDDALTILDTREPFGDAFYESIQPAHAALRSGIAKAGPPLDVDIVATGHAHLDVAWLWTVDQIRRKAGRTFHTVLRLMDQFSDYHFTQSQPQIYDYVRQDYPELFAAIQQQVADGRWELTGGMWVEADCNLSGSESLARQFLLGRSFFHQYFGREADSPVLWLPDVFGYAWALPQLIKEAGLKYFFTIKLGWNQYNRLPYDTFWWQGLDGTRVLTHFSTTPDISAEFSTNAVSTYTAEATPKEAIGTWTNFQQPEMQNTLFMAFGFGDGGGGPTREMLENIREMKAFPATPRMRQAGGADFFRGVEAESGDRLPTWNGELYFELHRGTYTTHSRNKRANRKAEFLLHDAEYLAALAKVLDPAYIYPAATLRKAWELVCLNQFHDIIPGTSIGEVYVSSLQQYGEVHDMATQIRNAALTTIARSASSPGAASDGPTSQTLLLVNPTSFVQSRLAYCPHPLERGQCLYRGKDADAPLPTQVSGEGTWIAAGDLGPYSVVRVRIAEGQAHAENTDLFASPNRLENGFLRVELDHAGDITRIYDKANRREVLAPDAIANQFQAFEDRPMKWDAWDVDIFYEDKRWLSEAAASVTVVESGPLRATIEVKRRILHSDYVQRISLAHHESRLDFDTRVDWRERHVLLKVAFPVNILASAATYEIQWGHVERPTHRNTSWDWARFETCAQKWVDLSEGDYGISLLNDCKYGHDIKDNVMRISLLRSPTAPDPEADQGEHHFVYSLLPHAGGWQETTLSAAYALNDPLIVYPAEVSAFGGETKTAAPAMLSRSFAVCDVANVVVETIKQAEDGHGVIVRLYEAHRCRGEVTLTMGFTVARAWRTNLLEENQAQLACEGNCVRFDILPHQILTLRLIPD